MSLAVIATAALVLRLIGIDYGLPFIYTADGEYTFVDPAMAINRTGNLHPGFFGHPGSTVIYPFAVLIRGLYLAQRALGQVPSFAAFEAGFVTDPTAVYVLLRSYTAVLGTLVVVLTYVVAAPVFGRRAALVGALLTAVAPYQHEWSRIARTDIPVTLFGLVATGAALRIVSSPPGGGAGRWYLAAGAAAGLACASKYPGGIALLAPLVALVVRAVRDRERLLGLAPLLTPLGFVVAFFGTSPYLILDAPTALAHIGAEFEVNHLGAERLPGIWNTLWYFYSALPVALGITVWAVALPAALIATGRDPGIRLTFAAFPIGYLAVMMAGTLRWANWVIPTLPFFAVWAGWGLERIAGLAARRWPDTARWALPGLVALVATVPTAQVLAADYRSLLVDTRTEATAWYQTGLPRGAKVAFEFYAGQPPPGIVLDNRGLLGNKPFDEFRAEGYDYLVLSDWMYGRVYAEPEKFAREVGIYEDIFTRGDMVREFDPRVLGGWLGRRGPTIRVVRVR